jgi:biopolymer transport protein ExbD/biopolymer transport protein TolR
MRALSRKGNSRPKPLMNVTPLVDVVLVLLIIFMVIVPMMDKTPVELPNIFHVDAEAKSKTDPFTLSVTSDGSMYFEAEQLDPVNFKGKLTAALEKDPSRRLVLRGDRGANYGSVRKLFKACQEVGFPGISLRVNEIKSLNDKAKAK